MFWTDIGVLSDDVPAKIERATMDGSGRRAIITSRIRMPRSITVDNPPESAGLGGRLYWTDSFYGIIYSSSLFGEDVRAVLGVYVGVSVLVRAYVRACVCACI